MHLGLIFTGGGLRIADLVTLARQTESAGFDSLFVTEAWRSPWVPLTAVAAATTRIRLGPYVINAYGRSPLVAGMTAIDFNEFSNGRLVLGVGGGNRIINEVWQGVAHARVLTKMGEYVELLRRMAHTRLGETLTYSGQVHHMQWSPAVDPGARPYPIVLAAVFPSMLAIAARVADGIGGGATLSVEYLRDVVRPRVARDAAGARRPLPRFYAVGLLALDSDRERARHAARAAIAHFYAPLPHPYYDYTLREQGFSAAADACLECVPAGRVAAALAAIPDELVDHLTIAGTFDDCVARVRAYAGVVDELLLLNVMPPTSTSVVAGYHALMQLPRHLASSA